MKVRKTASFRFIPALQKIRISGNFMESRIVKTYPVEFPIVRIDREFYKVKKTLEVKRYRITSQRCDDMSSLLCSIGNVRAIINANFKGGKNEAWVTLTYKENMTDKKRLMNDRQKFWYKLKRKYPQYDLEYMAIAEPQARGAWHLHEIWKCQEGVSLYIPQSDILSLWGQGAVHVKRLKGVDNIGAYLSAYLTNTEKGKKHDRLTYYPKGFNFYRCSRGLERPEWQRVRKLPEVSAKVIYEKNIEIEDDTGKVVQAVQYRTYKFLD